MNELPDDLVLTPQPVVGLIGCQTLHFYIDQYLSTKHLIDFERVHPITPSANTNNSNNNTLDNNKNRDSGNFSSSPSIDPLSILNNNNNNSPSNLTYQLSELTIQQQQQSSDDIFKSPNASRPLSTSQVVEVGGWRVQSTNAPLFKVITLEAGSLSNKKEKKINEYPFGILKANWIHKHTFSIPSVITLFIQWPEDKNQKSHDQILSQIDLIKANIKSRNIKLIVIIVTSQNLDHDEKIVLVRRKADIDPKYFLFLNKQDIKPFVKKWERLALELSDQYYKEMCQNTKSQIAKSNHPFLSIRYHFKIAFYSEFRNDTASSLKYYKDSYNLLKDYKPINDNRGIRFAEIRTLASFFNLKICKISMWNNYIQDALLQFERHIKLYKIYMGPAEKEFTHCIWLAREYQIFAELLEMCPAANKSNFITNPGFYYQISAKHQGNRRDNFKALSDHYKTTANVSKYRDIKPRYDLTNLNYIGQPPPDVSHPLEISSGTSNTSSPLINASSVTSGNNSPLMISTSSISSTTAIDQQSHYEEMILIADEDDLSKSIAIELSLNYTQLIIDTLTRAYDQSTTSGNHRILSYIESLIAYEYFTSKQYDLALKYYNKNAFTYRREKWTTLLTHSLSMLLKSVHHLNLPTNYIGYALDYLSPELNNTQSDRTNIQNSIIQLLTNSEALNKPTSQLPQLLLQQSLDITMDHIHPLLDCRVQFPSSFTFTNSTTEFYVVIGAHFPNAIRFSSLKVIFSEKSYNKSIQDTVPIQSTINLSTIKKDDEIQRKDLIFLPDESRIFTFKLQTKEKMELECKSVILELGNIGTKTINFIWNVQEWAIKSDETEIEKTNTPTPTPPVTSKTSKITKPTTPTPQTTLHEKPNPYKKFLERSSIRILDHESLIQIKCNHNSPAIVNEFYKIELEIINNDKEIKKGTIRFEINNNNNNQQQQALTPANSQLQQLQQVLIPTTTTTSSSNNNNHSIYFEPNNLKPLNEMELPTICEGKSFKKVFYVYSSAIDENKLLISISYETKSGEISHTSKLFSIPVVIGFNTQFQFFNEHFQLITDLYDQGVPTRESLLLLSEIKSQLPYNVIIVNTRLQISTAAESARNATLSPTGGVGGSAVPIITVDDSISNLPVVQLLSDSNKPLLNVELSKDRNYSSWFNLIPLIISESISFGSLIIEWKRKDQVGSSDSNVSYTSTIPIQLPYIRTTSNPFLAQVHVPSFGVVGTPLTQTIVIQNNTNFLQEFDLLVINPPSYGNSDIPFFFSGDKQSTFSIHPDSTHEIKHILLPLVAGKLNLPHFKITSKRFNKELTKTKNTNNFIFVKPNSTWSNQ